MSLESYIAEYTFSLVHLCINQSKIYHYILLFTSQPVNPSIYLALSRGEAFQMWICADDPYAGCILARNDHNWFKSICIYYRQDVYLGRDNQGRVTSDRPQGTVSAVDASARVTLQQANAAVIALLVKPIWPDWFLTLDFKFNSSLLLFNIWCRLLANF